MTNTDDMIAALVNALINAEVAMLEIDATRAPGTDPVFAKEIAEARRVLQKARSGNDQ